MRFHVVVIAGSTLLAIASACGHDYGAADPPPADVDAAADAATLGDGETAETAPPLGCLTPQKLGNDETCLCSGEAPGASQGCSLGKVGGKSACLSGAQTCGPGSDGMKRWGPCNGATKPAAKETCFDDVDDDCDGVLNNGCACSDVALCKDPATGNDFPGDALVFDKTTVKNGDVLNVLFLSKQAIGVTWLQIGPGVVCAGGGDTAPCPLSGCLDWNVERRKIDVTVSTVGLFRSGAGTYTITFRRGVTSAEQAACTPGPNTVSATVTVTN